MRRRFCAICRATRGSAASIIASLLEIAGFEVEVGRPQPSDRATVWVVETPRDGSDATIEAAARECAKRGCTVIMLGQVPTTWDGPEVRVIDKTYDFDTLRTVINEAAEGASS